MMPRWMLPAPLVIGKARMSDSASSDDGGAHDAAMKWSKPAKQALLKRLNTGRVVVFSLPTQRDRGGNKNAKIPRQIVWDEVAADLDTNMEFIEPEDIVLPKG
eukprot:jgi/Mesvir1/4044/Mv04886-RA.1